MALEAENAADAADEQAARWRDPALLPREFGCRR
jgi:hypothetical protein